jgi:hypothetical protein
MAAAPPIDAKLFRKAKRANLVLQFTDTELILPAKADNPEIRVRLPNRREKTMEEREAVIAERQAQIAALEEEIETERKELRAKVESFRALGTGGSEVVVQNLKVKSLMERRSLLARPERWIDEVDNVGPKAIFLEKQDLYKLNAIFFEMADVMQLVRRKEPMETLYVDIGAAAAAERVAQEAAEGEVLEAAQQAEESKRLAAAEKRRAATELPGVAGGQDAAAAARTGAIAGARKVIKLKKTATAPAGGPTGGAGGAGGV